MTAETLTFSSRFAVPIVTLATIVGLIAGISELERSRDELIELGVSGDASRPHRVDRAIYAIASET